MDLFSAYFSTGIPSVIHSYESYLAMKYIFNPVHNWVFLVSQVDYLTVITWYVCEFLDGIGNSSGFTGVKLDPLKHVHMVCVIPGYSK